MPSTLDSLTPEVLDSVLSEFIFNRPDIGEAVEHFAGLMARSTLLRQTIESWSAENRAIDLFTLAVWLGWQCRYSVEEGRRLNGLVGPL